MNQTIQGFLGPSYQDLQNTHTFKDVIRALTSFLPTWFKGFVDWSNAVTNVINGGVQSFGADIASAATIAPTNWAHRISGSSNISTVTAPKGFQSFIVLLALNGFTFTAGGNISNPVSVTAGHPAVCFYDPIGTKWWILTA